MMCVCVRTGWHGILLFDYLHRTPSVPNSEAKKTQQSVHRPSELFENWLRHDLETTKVLQNARIFAGAKAFKRVKLSVKPLSFVTSPSLCLGTIKILRIPSGVKCPKKCFDSFRLVQYYQSHQINLLNQHARLVKFCVMATTCNYFIIVPSTDPGNSRHVQSAKKKSWPRCCMRLLKVCNRLYIMFI